MTNRLYVCFDKHGHCVQCAAPSWEEAYRKAKDSGKFHPRARLYYTLVGLYTKDKYGHNSTYLDLSRMGNNGWL